MGLGASKDDLTLRNVIELHSARYRGTPLVLNIAQSFITRGEQHEETSESNRKLHQLFQPEQKLVVPRLQKPTL